MRQNSANTRALVHSLLGVDIARIKPKIYPFTQNAIHALRLHSKKIFSIEFGTIGNPLFFQAPSKPAGAACYFPELPGLFAVSPRADLNSPTLGTTAALAESP